MSEDELLTLLKENENDILRRYGSWHEFLKVKGLLQENTLFKNKVENTRENMIKSLKNFSTQTSGRITESSYRKSGFYPKLSMILKEFGSFDKALEDAGINKDALFREKCINAMKLAFDQSVYKLTPKTYSEIIKIPTLAQIRAEFGTWENGCKIAGVNTEDAIKEKLLQSLREVGEEFGGKLTWRKYEKTRSVPGVRLIHDTFGSFAEAVKMAGLEHGTDKEDEFEELSTKTEEQELEDFINHQNLKTSDVLEILKKYQEIYSIISK